MKVKDVMNKDVITCEPDDSVGFVSGLLRKNHISGLPVVDNEKVVGLVTETDLLKLFKIPEFSSTLWLPSPFEVFEIPVRNILRIEEMRKAFEHIKLRPVKDIMTRTIYEISSEDSLEEASSIMVKHKVNRLPVIDNGKIVGIVARSDIIRGLSESAD